MKEAWAEESCAKVVGVGEDILGVGGREGWLRGCSRGVEFWVEGGGCFWGDRSCWWFALKSVFEAARAGVDEEVG